MLPRTGTGAIVRGFPPGTRHASDHRPRGWGLEKSIVSFCGSIFWCRFRNRAQSLHHDILLSRCDVSRAPTLNRLHSTTRRGTDALCHSLHSALRSPSLPHFSFAIPLFFLRCTANAAAFHSFFRLLTSCCCCSPFLFLASDKERKDWTSELFGFFLCLFSLRVTLRWSRVGNREIFLYVCIEIYVCMHVGCPTEQS